MNCSQHKNPRQPGRTIRPTQRFAAAIALACLVTTSLPAQYPTRAREKTQPNSTTRALAVVEWIGAEGKPTASRLIPISIYVNGHFQDAGLFLARPEPMALDPGTRYEIDQTGKPIGFFDVNTAGRVPAGKYETFWVGLGKWQPYVTPPKPRTNQKNKLPRPEVAIDDGQPHLLRRPGSESTTDDKSTSDKSTTNKSGSGSSTSSNSGSNNSGPVLKRRDGADNTANTGTIDNSGDGNPPDDPDRPRIKRAPAKPAAAPGDTGTGDAPANGAETNLAKLGDDPNRPNLHRGKPTSGQNADPDTQLQGTPIQMQQRVAVSDATNRDPHPFTYNWSDQQTLDALKIKLEAIAQKALAANAPTPAVPATPTKPTPKTATPTRTRKPVKPTTPPPPDNTLTDETISSYELAYDAGATIVYSAHTPGEGAHLRYVTLIAQVDIYGEPTILLTSTTDEAHLDQTPQMKLVDAVDADGGNRGELLFQLRAEKDRQFALYRIYGGAATQIFLTGSMP